MSIVRYFIFLIITQLLINSKVFGVNLDSLKNIVQTSDQDTLVCHAYATWGANIYGSNPDSAIILWQKAIVLAEKNIKKEHNQQMKNRYYYSVAQCSNNLGLVFFQQGRVNEAEKYLYQSYRNYKKINDKIEIANILNSLGYFYGNTGQINKSINYINRSLKIYSLLGYENKKAAVMTNLAYRYDELGQVEKSLELNYQALKIKEEIGNLKSIAYSLNNIAYIYNKQGNQKKALEYFERCLEIRLKINDKSGTADVYNNLGKIYLDRNEYIIAEEYFNKAIKLYRQVKDKSGLISSFTSLGKLHQSKNEQNKALDYYFMAQELAIQTQNRKFEAKSLSLISSVYLSIGQVSEAEKFAIKSLKLSRSLNIPELINESAKILSDIYYKNNENKQALTMYKLHIQMRDSLKNESTQKAIIEQQAKYEYEKQKAIDDAVNDKKIAVAKEVQAKQKILIYAIVGVLVLVVVFLFFVFNRLKVTRRQNVIIEKQKYEVENAHKEIKDSINYAERIQRSFLATDEILNKNLTDYFVFFQPKDVVSGDFYWASKLANNQFAIVNADSTGHGVPGAIMSILNISSLEKSVEKGMTNPAQIFNETRKIIIDRLKKDGSEDGGKDGMDASIIAFDFDNNKFNYAAAQNPIWIVRNNELIEIKPEKMPVGKHDNDIVPFVGGQFETQKGDMIYTITDGFQDQFGGDKNKKFKVKPFKDYLVSIAHLSMQEQKEKLAQTFYTWKGEEEQVDDVCVIGIKV